MEKRFIIETVIENGYPHYRITDLCSNNVISCDCNELTETLCELMDK